MTVTPRGAPAHEGEAVRSGARRRSRRLVARVLIVQALTLAGLYLLQLRFGLGAG